ncbi:MAG: FdtA/QdtA family cupin domain-containing protein [Bdellovibrionales bacterium]|nr:FdtA/QdtA family cupin domain-containing protein [Bdellovibrionales bacterium]
MAKILNLPTFSESRGDLTVIDKIIPFDIKRIFYIYNASGIRGGHRHKKNIQALICVSGRCEIYNNNGSEKSEYILDKPDKCLILDPEDWHTMRNFSDDAILLVLASEHYDQSDYIDAEYTT